MAVLPDPKHTMPDVAALHAMGKRLIFVGKVLGPNREQMIVNGTGQWANASVEQILTLQNELPRSHGAGLYHFQVTDETGASPGKVDWTTRLGAGPDTLEATTMAMPGTDQAIHQLGGGMTYNEFLGLLTTRDGRVFPWQRGEPLPPEVMGLRGSPAIPAATELPVQFGRSGGYDPRIEELLRDRREDKLERGLTDVAKMIADSNAQVMRMIEKMTERPSGPDPLVASLQRELEESKRRAEDDRRAAEARAEADRRDAAHRAEMQAIRDSIKESAGNRQDPVLALLGQIITTMQGSSNAQAANVKDVAQLIAERMGSSALTPERLLEVLRIAKDRGPENEIMNHGLEMYRQLFGMTQEVLRQQQELAKGDQPAWWESALDKFGTVGQQIMAERERVSAEKQAKQEQAERVRAVNEARMREAQRRQQAGGIPQPGQVVGQGPPAVAAAPPAPPVQAAPITPEVVSNGAPKKRGRPKKQINVSEVSTDEIRAVVSKQPDEVFFGPFFTYVVDRLRKPHARNALTFYDAAKTLLQSRAFFQQAAAAGQLPPAAELLIHGQLEVLVERTLPEALPGYQQQVVDSLRAQLQAVSGPVVDTSAIEEADGEEEAEIEGDDAEAA